MTGHDRQPFNDKIPTFPTHPLYGDIIGDILEIDELRANAYQQANTLRVNVDKLLTATQIAKLQHEIISELSTMDTIQGRFACMLDPRFVSYINSVDLGRVAYDKPLSEFQKFEAECGDLINTLDSVDSPVARFTSSDPKCNLSCRTSLELDSKGNRVAVVTRNRRLAEVYDPVYDRTLKIRKRMTFLLTTPEQYGRIVVEQHDPMQRVVYELDNELLQIGLHEPSPTIIPISTVYIGYVDHMDKPK
ncbi:MAG: hypothetical protein ABIQ04_02990 [Candidatus Saccharimonadales bacterium]